MLLLRDLGLMFAVNFVLLLVLAKLLALRLELGKGDQLSLLGELLLPLYGSLYIALVGLLLQRRVLLLQAPSEFVGNHAGDHRLVAAAPGLCLGLSQRDLVALLLVVGVVVPLVHEVYIAATDVALDSLPVGGADHYVSL